MFLPERTRHIARYEQTAVGIDQQGHQCEVHQQNLYEQRCSAEESDVHLRQ